MSDTEKSTGNASFVGRWSQRKLQKKSEQSREQTQPTQLATPAEELALQPQDVLLQGELTGSSIHPMIVPEPETDTADTAVALEKSIVDEGNELEEPLLTDADMPDIQSLTAQSDVSPFLNPGVSKALRKAALSYIFSLPRYNIRDGLNDYDEDYTLSTWEPLGDIQTCDMKFHAERKEKLRLEEERLERERLEAEVETETETETSAESEEIAADDNADDIDQSESTQNELTPDETESNQLDPELNTKPSNDEASEQSIKVEHA